MVSQTINTPPAAAENPQPASTLTPEAVVEQLRTMRTQMGDPVPLTPAQRKLLHRRTTPSNAVLQASINVMGAHDGVAVAIGQPAADVRQMYEEANRWTAVEDELRMLLKAVTGMNLLRRQRIALITTQAVNIGVQLARDPANAILVPHVQEVRRLKSFSRRKKAAPTPTPEPPPAPSEHPPA
jgi:hypothetical protein